ncbi:hypothetical protein THAOC_27935 [Thalassiosira oceanica]|uniref:BspA family leucine-rich repeat surface protein n=1 Tax=Thalassiosira oceanica TaxID=159749 RepID=K0RKF5_THAOC|nr:hypothetical protein THAOC_27935 [Thalassiosira oceanica]|eukprot:EJK52759.1 hypothetical protein THAOC_27935 [Thalassiosira oceanica]
MVASNIALVLLSLAMAMANAGTNKSALGVDAPEYDQRPLARSLAVPPSEQRAAWTPTSSHSDGDSLEAGGASSPSVSRSVSFKFTTNAELRTAIREYLSQGCPDVANCQAHSDYGDTIGDWDVSRVEDFDGLFVNNYYNSIPGAAAFNEPINWDTGSATTMKHMFYGALAFNQPLSFHTAKMSFMFYGTTAFNQPLSFDTAKMGSMFYGATAFNQPLSFDTAEMWAMFDGASAFNQDLCHFGDNFSLNDVQVEDMFQDSGCSNKDSPNSASGPWCAATTCQ